MARFTVDAGARTVVLVCTSCRTWRTGPSTRARAWAEARRHEQRAHETADPNTKNRASAWG